MSKKKMIFLSPPSFHCGCLLWYLARLWTIQKSEEPFLTFPIRRSDLLSIVGWWTMVRVAHKWKPRESVCLAKKVRKIYCKILTSRAQWRTVLTALTLRISLAYCGTIEETCVYATCDSRLWPNFRIFLFFAHCLSTLHDSVHQKYWQGIRKTYKKMYLVAVLLLLF